MPRKGASKRTKKRLEGEKTATVAVPDPPGWSTVMARFHISVKPYRSDTHPNAKWVLNVWHPTGKRERRFFGTIEAALAEQSVKQVEVENLGLRALEISSRLRFEALDAQERLAG